MHILDSLQDNLSLTVLPMPLKAPPFKIRRRSPLQQRHNSLLKIRLSQLPQPNPLRLTRRMVLQHPTLNLIRGVVATGSPTTSLEAAIRTPVP